MIDKNIFQVSINLNHEHKSIQKIINKTKSLNPDYKYTLVTEESYIDKFVNDNFPGEIANSYNKLNILVAKIDFWRYLTLYKYGGVYLDMDSEINYPLKDLIKENDDAIITAEGNPNLYVQWALIFSKNHYILKKTIELIVENIQYNKYPNNIHKMTGPSVFSDAINICHKELFNNNIVHILINKKTDITFKKDNISYRLYSIDYNNYFSFKHNAADILYKNPKSIHWTIEQKIKPLLKL
jgi:mannosyltransferase OCH1-like enzyme